MLKLFTIFTVVVLCGGFSIPSEFIKENNDFSISLYQEMIRSHTANFAYGIFPLDAMIALTYLGIEGEAASQIKSVFAWNATDDQIKLDFQGALQTLEELPHCEIRVCNRIFVADRLNINPKFTEIAPHFGTNVAKIDFSAAKQAVEHINNWVSNRTSSKIGNWVNEKHFNAKTDLVFVNNIFLKAKWLHQFDKRETKKMDFHVSSNETVQVDMMKISGEFMMARHPSFNITMVKIPYKNDKLYMAVFLADDIDNVDHIAQNARQNWYERNFTSKYVTIFLPKFEITFTTDMMATLKNMGVTKLFSEEIKGITKEAAKVSVVTQRIYVDVNERGTIAEDTPVIEHTAKKHKNPKEEGQVFNVNHPFVFGILYDDFSLVFGRINKI